MFKTDIRDVLNLYEKYDKVSGEFSRILEGVTNLASRGHSTYQFNTEFSGKWLVSLVERLRQFGLVVETLPYATSDSSKTLLIISLPRRVKVNPQCGETLTYTGDNLVFDIPYPSRELCTFTLEVVGKNPNFPPNVTWYRGNYDGGPTVFVWKDSRWNAVPLSVLARDTFS